MTILGVSGLTKRFGSNTVIAGIPDTFCSGGAQATGKQ